MRRWLLPFAWLYGGLATARRAAYRRGYLPAGRAPVPVVSVGALAAGGSGKTPVAGWLAGFLLAQGLRVGLVHGGYRGGETDRVHCIDPTWRWEVGAAARFGDEPLLLAGWHPGALVFAGRDKLAAARRAAEAGAQVVVIDDGFQHRRLHRDLDLLLDDGVPELPFPVGRAREPAAVAADADLRWEHGRAGERPAGDAPIASRCLPDLLFRLDGATAGAAQDLRGRRVFLLAGIARPEAFLHTVQALGAEVVGQRWVRDHAPFGARELRAAARARADVLVCTEKDAVRMLAWGPRELVFLSCRVELARGRELLQERLRQLDPGSA